MRPAQGNRMLSPGARLGYKMWCCRDVLVRPSSRKIASTTLPWAGELLPQLENCQGEVPVEAQATPSIMPSSSLWRMDVFGPIEGRVGP